MSNRIFFCCMGVIVIVGGVISREVFLLDEIPDKELYRIHLNTLDKIAERIENDCIQQQKIANGSLKKSLSPNVLRALHETETIMSFRDSAEYYFDRINDLRARPDSARACYADYLQFSHDFGRKIQEITGKENRNYLETMEQHLIGKRFPFDSEEDIELIVLLSREEFYQRMKYAQDEVLTFSRDSY